MKRMQLSRGRILAVAFLAVFFWGVAVARLVQVQILEHSRAEELAERQVEGWLTMPADRGYIYDRNGRLLAINQSRTTYAAVPAEWDTKAKRLRAARRLASVTDRNVTSWLKRFEQSPQFIYVVRHADEGTVRKIESWKDDAIFTMPEPGRQYTAQQIGRELLGNVDIDNRGVAGIEEAFESLLAGKPARGRVKYDAKRELTIDPLPASLAVDGSDIHLTLDWRWQEIVEQELQAAIERTGAKGGGAILMSTTGAIRALGYRVSETRADANPTTSPRCRPVTDLYEPGSTFKAMVAAALLSEETVEFTDSVFADSGAAMFMDRLIEDSEPHLWLTFDQSLIVSSNIAFGKWAQRLGGESLYRWIRDFGFGTSTDLGLGAEPHGVVPNHKRWNELRLVQLAMGHSISVTPLQMVIAFAVFANRGDLYRPRMVDFWIEPDGDTVRAPEAERVRHLLSPSIVQSMRELLARVVSEGTAKPAMSKAITIAGKTGTAQKVREDGKGYYQNKYVASFVGFFPADDPQVVGIVYLDEPVRFYFGGWSAGPAFRNIAERLAAIHPELLRYPVTDGAGELPPPPDDPVLTAGLVPDLVGLPVTKAAMAASQLGYRFECTGSGCVKTQSPRAGKSMRTGGTISVRATRIVDLERTARGPDPNSVIERTGT